MSSRRMRLDRGETVFNVLAYAVITALTVLCLVPFLLIVSGSLTAEEEIFRGGYTLVPRVWSLKAYRAIFGNAGAIARAYAVTVGVTTVGTAASVLISALAAFVLHRRDFRLRNMFALYFYFTAIFAGGLVPQYIWVVRYLMLKNTLLALVLPGMLVPFNIFLIRNFMATVPESIMESAIVDGAGDLTVWARIFMPLSVPGIVTVGLFRALQYWNDWMHARLYITRSWLYPIQYYLYNMLTMAESIDKAAAEAGVPLPEFPAESIKLAMAVIATGPIVLLYPYVQRFFVKGITLGAVKG